MEIVRDLSRGFVARVTKSALIAVFMLASYAVATFLVSVDSAVSQGLSANAQREMLSITDELVDPDEFSNYSNSKAGIRAASQFYEGLDSLPHGTFLSAFGHHIAVENFAGGPEFHRRWSHGGSSAPYEHPMTKTGPLQSVKSMQLNKATWDFYGLEVSEGAEFAWADVDYQTQHAPVVLGEAYRGVYELGDTMRVDFYFQVITVTVVGFLQERSHMYYKGDFNHSLDTSMILAYPSKLPEKVSEENETLYRIMTFAMISGDIAIAQGSPPSQVVHDVKLVSQKSQFHSYTFLGVSDYLVQYTLVKDLVLKNRNLVMGLLCMVAVLGVFVAGWANRRTADERREWVTALWVLGEPRTVVAQVVLRSGLAYAALTVMLLCVGIFSFPGKSHTAFFAIMVALAATIIIDLADELRLARQILARAER